MDSIVEQIAREVMLKLKTESANRGTAYTPPPQRDQNKNPVIRGTGSSAILLTANFKVVDQVLSQLKAVANEGTRVIVSSLPE